MTTNKHFYRDDLRMGISRPHPSWNVTDWYLDPLNRTGLADDRNDGTDPTIPVQTWNGGVVNKWGTLVPILGQKTNFHWLSGSPMDGSDPIVCIPSCTQGAFVYFLGLLDSHNLVKTGTLASVTAKNRTTGQLLQADLGAGVAPGMLVVNTTVGKSSRCYTYTNVSGTVFSLEQPTSIPTNWNPSTADSLPVDTWANGDTFAVYQPDQLDLLQFHPRTNIITHDYTHQILTLAIMSGSTFGESHSTYLGDAVALLHCGSDRRFIVDYPGSIHPTFMWGCDLRKGFGGGTWDIQGIGVGPWVMGGRCHSAQCASSYFDLDVIFDGSSRVTGGQLSSVCVDAGASLALAEEVMLIAGYESALLWGKGATDVKGNLILNGTTAAAGLLQPGAGGTLTLNTKSAAFSATLANPSVINGNVPLTPANIDAAVGVAGFGGNAFIPGGGSIRTFG